MFGGGVSDKFGNIYESLWAVRQLLDVLYGRKRAIRLEGISKEFKGFEFAIDEGDFKSWHQTKINAQSQNWTIRALEREGVLDAFAARLSATTRDRCVFVSQSPAVDLADLSSKASYASDFADFDRGLLPTPREKFVSFYSTVEVEPAVAFDWLRRCEFRTLPQDEIMATVEDFASLLFENKADAAYPALRAYLEGRLNRDLTTETVRAEIPSDTELRIKEWSLKPTLRSKLQDETEGYLNSFTPFGASGHILERSQADEIISLLKNPSGPRVVMVSGVAGCGKSGVVREVLKDLDDREVVHLAFRVDQHLECKSSLDFGKALLGSEESPVTVLKGLSPTQTAVLVVDQLDAISEISGRNGTSKNAVLRMIDEARRYATVRVVLVCRTFDIENDERIKLLKQSSDFNQVNIPLLEWEDDVAPLLAKLQVNAEALDTTQQELLRLPLNLAVFAEIGGAGDTQFASRNDLFEKLLRKKQSSIVENRAPPGWALMAPLTRLSEWMSSRQKLDAPASVLDDFHRGVDILASEHLIVRSRNTVSFFHESFFDYVFARSFAAGKQSVVDLLTSTEQHLFRRTQVRQILESLRQSDHSRYLCELKEVLNSSDVRFHIKIALAKWLAALGSPTISERNIVLALDDHSQPFSIVVRTAIQGTAGWFDILVENGWLAQQLESPVEQRRRVLLWWLESVAGDRPERVAAILDAWWRGDDKRATDLFQWFGYIRRQKTDTALIELCTRLMASQPSILFAGNDLRRELLIATWIASENVDGSSSILKTYFNAWFEHHPDDHPFARDAIKELDLHSLSELGKKSPRALLEGTVDALARTFQIIEEKTISGAVDYTFHYRPLGEVTTGSDRFLQFIRSALQRVALENPDVAGGLLDRIDPRKNVAAIHLHLETVAANPSALSIYFLAVLEFPEVFEAGWEGARWKSFADAARGTLPHLAEVDRCAVEDVVLTHWPEIAYAKEFAADSTAEGRRYCLGNLARSGYEQFCILHTIGPETLGRAARSRLAELGRKFQEEDVGQPNQFQMTLVRSPISDSRAKHMSDENWLEAIEEYHSDSRRDRGDRRTGGARQLALVLNSVTKAHPVRFARLLPRIPSNANHVYAGQLLQGLVEAVSVDLDTLRVAILNAHERVGRPFGEIICRAFHNYPDLCEDEPCWTALLWYIQFGHATDSRELSDSFAGQELVTIEYLVERGSKLHIRGINSVRGWALEALTQVLWHIPQRRSQAWELLESRVGTETDLSVRCCLTGPLTPMFNVDKIRCACLLERLVEQSLVPDNALSPLITRPATALLPYFIHQVPDTGNRLLNRMAVSEDERTRLVAAWHVMRASYHDSTYVDWAESLERSHLDARRLSADIASQAIAEATLRARSVDKVRRYFDDEDDGVRKKAAQTFRHIPRDQFDLLTDLAKHFLDSRAFYEDSFAFLHLLEEVQGNVADLVIASAEKLLADATTSADGPEKHDMAWHQLHELINLEYANSEQEPELRKRLLDVVDRVLLLELRGAEQILKKHER
ncbi:MULTISPECIES: ATP-binding protein [Rhizobium]|uniref:ATP-binding protein n=1 Tax=Rhizobium johnstonii (strain DSM 114642 / LMG 32736 / 3841) TaxID=216596 RepID=Q1MHG5_RHIJ3|nr:MULTISPECIES: ATP-binding protein [Rhizobium]NEI94575.1 hypothetical protein [Rhizobium leguminosarum]NEJ78810.1 hypothetical protein [Rhizobium leguminosarum]CAK07598.1 conserved hypothetical protein [Rhizobium johnstonii 3841]